MELSGSIGACAPKSEESVTLVGYKYSIDNNNKLDKIIELLEQILFRQSSIENYLCEMLRICINNDKNN